ncbi:potassium transporter [Caldichromatium japonicum]|uniref:Trk system potassium uptake protein n=1 Tax=Caldichromatium japonicum TaxID=2699430 RepID=A0A6G7VDA1_9GAMM|nr:TrkH family potassium uptake protein [Caldichromatium japonicum]QIK38029.1 potassium transporter [Caldichromatium japonicum]
MHWRAITRLFGLLLLLYSLSFLPSLGVALLYEDGQSQVFLDAFMTTAALGLSLWLTNRHCQNELSIRDGFLAVALFWVILGVVGALPFVLGLHLALTDAIFESISGFTTTGATIITELDRLPPSILYHRQQTQWLGGIGVIVLAVAVLPLLGVGGMQLYRAETSGVAKHEKPTPRIRETARALWSLYVGLTAACTLCFWLAGMSAFDAIGHAFSTISTGGFSTHDASIGYYDSPLIEAVAIVFMLAGGINFTVHFAAFHHLDIRYYARDPETRDFVLIFLGGALFIAASLYWANTYADAWSALRHGSFQVASILTSTGFGTATFGTWPLHIPLALVILSFVGGCGGSTAGGIKVLRVMLLIKLGIRQLFQFNHPHAVLGVKIGPRAVSEDVLLSVWGFYVLYVAICLLLTLAMMAAGLDLESAFGAAFTTVNLCGPGLGEVAVNFATVDDVVKWLGIFGMLAGRLEVFTLMILFTPSFWRH